jgi:hypothetical protein
VGHKSDMEENEESFNNFCLENSGITAFLVPERRRKGNIKMGPSCAVCRCGLE